MQRRQARKIVAHSASCGWRIRAMFFQPRRGERVCRRFLSPLRGSGHTRRMPLFPQLALWATIFRPLRGLISVTFYRKCEAIPFSYMSKQCPYLRNCLRTARRNNAIRVEVSSSSNNADRRPQG